METWPCMKRESKAYGAHGWPSSSPLAAARA
jgi:hypothetical protein